MSRFGPGDVLDTYRIDELLGAGAYAESYKATDTRDGRTVVLKVPDPNLFADPAIYNRYQREAQVSRRLNHPSVQGAVDVGESREEPYLVLAYVEGASLRATMREERGAFPTPVDTVVDRGRQLADGLSYLHSMGVVHRDLKPENVLVGKDGRLVIADFGTAQLEGARRLTWKHLSSAQGTPEYMSPEQAQGGRGDARSDIYAWGVMMYEMLAGRVPFTGDNWMATLSGHLTGDPKPIGRLRHDVPPGLAAVVTHAMRRHPENRYPSADELLADLDHLDQLDSASYDTSPEKPMGGVMATAGSAKRLWGKLKGGR
ncbi:MAG: serine/threonine protein kinase [Actinomycetota bacterium]|nr:serine/threonine protein kinase [Actinomycetota bacterium]